MPMALSSAGRRILLGAACLLFGAFYLYWAGRTYVASRLGEQDQRPALEQAVELEPWNARYRHRLGRYLLFADQDVSAALEHLRAAVRFNPHEARYWLDLATANQVAGNQAEQRRAIEQAIAAEPTTPTVAWEAANFFLVQGETQAALRQFRVVLEHDPNEAFQALELCWRVTGNAELLLDQVLPPRADIHLALLDLLALKNQEQAASLVWSRLLALKQRIESKRVLPYVQYLLNNRKAERAAEVWRQLPALSPEVAAYIPDDNLVVNGGFEQEILNYGFDWRSDPRPNVRVAIDTTEFHSGGRSLFVEFDGQGGGEPGVYQLVPVQPNTHYEFLGYVRSEAIESASGPRFALQDAYDATSYVLTDELLGTTPWRQHTASFLTGPETTLLLLKLARTPEQALIKGKIWVDDLRLTQR
jgi:thioredoxin-like negative regulator of GroEL